MKGGVSSSNLSVELHSQDGVGIGIVADLSSFLEVTDFELPGRLQTHDGHEAAGKQTLHDAHVLRVGCKDKESLFPII